MLLGELLSVGEKGDAGGRRGVGARQAGGRAGEEG